MIGRSDGALRFMNGNHAIAQAAILSGCTFFASYPLTPATEILEYMAAELPRHGGTCIQAESELAAINMVYGASAAGSRAMTATSSLGLSLMQECLSQMCLLEIPAVLVDQCREGPGLGGLGPSQADYFLATRGSGHGDSQSFVLAPMSVQEAADEIGIAFELAERYRNPVIILGDPILAQLMEPVRLGQRVERTGGADWVLTGARGRPPRGLGLYSEELEVSQEGVIQLEQKYRAATAEARLETNRLDDADFAIIAFGTMARIARAAVRILREDGIRVGWARPVTLWPFPSAQLARALAGVKLAVVAELSSGQMVDDVKLAVNGAIPVKFTGRSGRPIAPEQLARTVADFISEAARG